MPHEGKPHPAAVVRSGRVSAPSSSTSSARFTRNVGGGGTRETRGGIRQVQASPGRPIPSTSEGAFQTVIEDIGPSVTDELNEMLQGIASGLSGGGIDFLEQFQSNPLVEQLTGSLSAALENPDVISDEEEGQLRARAAETILGTSRDTLRGIREDLTRRGISDSGLGSALQRQSGDVTGRDIAASGRDISIQRALARSQRELAAQQTAASLTGLTLRAGQTGAQDRFNRDFGAAGILGQQQVFDPSQLFLDQAFRAEDRGLFEDALARADEEQEQALQAARDSIFQNIFGSIAVNRLS